MPYENEHAARIVEPSKFQQDSFRRKNISSGIDIIIGRLKGETTMTTQAYRFDAKKFTVEETKKWLKDHNIKYLSFEPAKPKSMRPLLLFTPIYSSTAEIFVEKLLEIDESEDQEFWINSPGGSVWGGYSMLGALNQRTGKNNAKVFGSADSMVAYMLLFMDYVEALDVSTFRFHRADGYIDNDNDKALLEKINKDLRAKMIKKIDAETFKEVTGISIDEMFDSEKRIDIDLDAKQAKKIGLINSIVRLEPRQIVAMSEKLIAFADFDSRGSELELQTRGGVKAEINIEQITTKKMTKEEFKVQNPELYNQIYDDGKKAGISSEKDRIEAFLEFVEIDAESVKKQITEGHGITNKFMAEMTKKMMISAQKSDIKDDQIDTQKPPREEKTAKEIEAADFKKAVLTSMNLKDEEKKS